MRHGSAGRFPTREDVILNRFDLSAEDLLGKGSESTVYAMDDEHVLRIYRDLIGWDYVEARRAFYAELGRYDLPFAVPHIYTIGSWVGHLYTVERRMHGQEMAKVLPTLEGAVRARALTSYLDAAAALGQVQLPDKPYGELLTLPPLQRDSWQEYLAARMAETLRTSRGDLEADVPGFDTVLAQIEARLPSVGEPRKCLVHGDFWPGNLFVNDEGVICGVGDFSYATVVGDARMDIAGAAAFFEMSPSHTPADLDSLRQMIAQRWGEEMLAIVDFYRLYYSIFFSGCKRDDAQTYWWCVGNLRAVGEMSLQ